LVLGLTIAIKFALWLYCKFVLRSLETLGKGGSGSIEAYAQVSDGSITHLLLHTSCQMLKSWFKECRHRSFSLSLMATGPLERRDDKLGGGGVCLRGGRRRVVAG
jgi:hypothetical protein